MGNYKMKDIKNNRGPDGYCGGLIGNKGLFDRSSGELLDELCVRHPEFFRSIREELGENYPQILDYFPPPRIEIHEGAMNVLNYKHFGEGEPPAYSG